MARQNQHDQRWAIAEQIHQARPQWLVTWGCCTRRFWGFPLFEMRRRVLAHDEDPGALMARMDEIERRYRVWPDRQRR